VPLFRSDSEEMLKSFYYIFFTFSYKAHGQLPPERRPVNYSNPKCEPLKILISRLFGQSRNTCPMDHHVDCDSGTHHLVGEVQYTDS